MIQRGQIPVGEPLARQVSDRQPLPACRWREKLVAGEPAHHPLLLVGRVHDQIHQAEQPPVLHDLAELLLEDGMVDAWKKLPYVALEGVSIPPHQLLEPPGCGVRSFPRAAGITIGVEVALQDRFEDIQDGMMNDPIPVGGSGNQPRLRPGDPVRRERTGRYSPATSSRWN